jgi:prevent-host-death family protein
VAHRRTAGTSCPRRWGQLRRPAGPRRGPRLAVGALAGRAQTPARQTPARQGAARQGAARQQIGIRELRQHASVYVDLAERGYTVDITNRGRLVAQLVPANELGSPLERLIAAGIIESAEEPGGVADIEPYPAPAAGRPSATEVLGQARKDKRR